MTSQRHPRRTVPVVILDAILGVVTAVQSGYLPWRRREPDDGAGTDERAGLRGRRTAGLWVAAAGAAVVVGTVSLVVAFLRSPDGLAPLGVGSAPPAAIEGPGATAPPGADGFGSSPPPVAPTSALPSSKASGRPSTHPSGGRTTVPPVAPPLTARYAAVDGGQGLLGYKATVAIANPGAVPIEGWRLTITLPRTTLTVAEVSGATVKRDGATWTFTPSKDRATVAAGGSATVSFEVRGATLVSATPTGCTIDSRPCQGIPA